LTLSEEAKPDQEATLLKEHGCSWWFWQRLYVLQRSLSDAVDSLLFVFCAAVAAAGYEQLILCLCLLFLGSQAFCHVFSSPALS